MYMLFVKIFNFPKIIIGFKNLLGSGTHICLWS